MKTKKQISESAQALADAEVALMRAKEAHKEAFKVALVALFNEYGLCVESASYGGLGILENVGEFTLDDLRAE